MIDALLNAVFDWLEFSRVPPVIAALTILALAVWQIWRELK